MLISIQRRNDPALPVPGRCLSRLVGSRSTRPSKANSISTNTKTPDCSQAFLCRSTGISFLQPDDHALKIARVEGGALGAVGTNDHRVGMTETANTRSVDARLDREHHVFLDHVVAALIDKRPLVPF